MGSRSMSTGCVDSSRRTVLAVNSSSVGLTVFMLHHPYPGRFPRPRRMMQSVAGGNFDRPSPVTRFFSVYVMSTDRVTRRLFVCPCSRHSTTY